MTEPYYCDETVTLYHGDALDVLSTVPPGSMHHVITDPPYILAAGSSGARGSKTGGWADMMNAAHWYAAWYRLCRKALKHEGSLWTFGNWRTLPCMMRAAIDADLPATSLLVWDKDWIGPAGPQQLRSQHEMCMCCAMPNFKQSDRSQGDVLRIRASSSKPTGHPAEKPVALLSRIVGLSGARPGHVILDPFAGSGTTGYAAKSLGVHSILIEAEERYCEIAAKRLAQGVLLGEDTA